MLPSSHPAIRLLHRYFTASGGLNLLNQNRFAGQLDAILVVDRDDFHFDLVADLADVCDRLHEAVGQFADVAQSVFAGSDFDEGTEVLDRASPCRCKCGRP